MRHYPDTPLRPIVMADAYLEQQRLVHNLLRADAFTHPVGELELLETHISWVVLAGDYAYKIKKPVDLGFLDYATLELRRHYCDEELRLNRRTAPRLYLDTVTLNGTVDKPYVGGTGPVLEYAVRMRRFPQSQLLDTLLHNGALTPSLIDALGSQVAAFHAAAAVAPASGPCGQPAVVHRPVRENFSQTLARIDDPNDRQRLERLAEWADTQYAQLQPLLERRLAEGFVRECHGDLHLGNIVLMEGKPLLFDGIEFSDTLRWVDVLCDTAFLVMDLQTRGRDDYAWRFLNAYLSRSGDYAGLTLLPYYLCYRAMVRAKVAAIRLQQADDDAIRRQSLAEFRAYLARAERYTQPTRPFLLLTSGPSGAGKSCHSQPLLEQLGIIRIRSDVERKRLFGLEAQARSGSPLASGIYGADASVRTYNRLAQLAETLIGAGFPVLVDATFLQRRQREAFRQLAERLKVPFAVLAFDAAPATLRARVSRRLKRGRDASEADLEVLERQLAQREPVAEEEQAYTLRVDTDDAASGATLPARLKSLLGIGE